MGIIYESPTHHLPTPYIGGIMHAWSGDYVSVATKWCIISGRWRRKHQVMEKTQDHISVPVESQAPTLGWEGGCLTHLSLSLKTEMSCFPKGRRRVFVPVVKGQCEVDSACNFIVMYDLGGEVDTWRKVVPVGFPKEMGSLLVVGPVYFLTQICFDSLYIHDGA